MSTTEHEDKTLEQVYAEGKLFFLEGPESLTVMECERIRHNHALEAVATNARAT